MSPSSTTFTKRQFVPYKPKYCFLETDVFAM